METNSEIRVVLTGNALSKWSARSRQLARLFQYVPNKTLLVPILNLPEQNQSSLRDRQLSDFPNRPSFAYYKNSAESIAHIWRNLKNTHILHAVKLHR